MPSLPSPHHFVTGCSLPLHPAPDLCFTSLPPVPGPLPPQVARDKLVALGTCIGKFTHSGKFRVTIGALDLLAQYAKYKVGCTAAQLR